MRYLWIGSIIDKYILGEMLDNGGSLLSSYVSQESLFQGIRKNGIECDSINSRPSVHYNHKLIRFREHSWANGKSVQLSVGYVHFSYFTLLTKSIALVRAIKKWAMTVKGEEITVFVYALYSPTSIALSALKRIFPNANIVQIVPDIPKFVDLNMGIIKQILKTINSKIIGHSLKSVDKYVLYSKYMAEPLHLTEEQYIVVEGSFNPDIYDSEYVEQDQSVKSVMYSGYLELKYGIPELLDAFQFLDEEYELWLAGDGNAIPLIKEKSAKDNRIKYLGYFSSQRDLLTLQKKATMLINPRNTKEIAFKYSFPSKTFEYMYSGNPVLCTRIAGIPDEYFDYIVQIKEATPIDIAEAIQRVGNMTVDERRKLGESGKNFVLKNKNNVAQTKRILDFAASSK